VPLQRIGAIDVGKAMALILNQLMLQAGKQHGEFKGSILRKS